MESCSSDEEEENFHKNLLICGLCKKEFKLNYSQLGIKCYHCGYRILYKVRTSKTIHYNTN